MTKRKKREEKVQTYIIFHLFLMIQEYILEKSKLNIMCDCKICTSKPEKKLISIIIFNFRG
jgi:hypothetical protein